MPSPEQTRLIELSLRCIFGAHWDRRLADLLRAWVLSMPAGLRSVLAGMRVEELRAFARMPTVIPPMESTGMQTLVWPPTPPAERALTLSADMDESKTRTYEEGEVVESLL